MKKLVVLFLAMLLISIFTIGCSQNTELPDGFENEQFYKDMTQGLDFVKKTLETKNAKYINDFIQIIKPYIPKTDGSNDVLNEDELEVIHSMEILRVELEVYMQTYFKDDSIDVGLLIDESHPAGKSLRKRIQETIGYMKIEYDLP